MKLELFILINERICNLMLADIKSVPHINPSNPLQLEDHPSLTPCLKLLKRLIKTEDKAKECISFFVDTHSYIDILFPGLIKLINNGPVELSNSAGKVMIKLMDKYSLLFECLEFWSQPEKPDDYEIGKAISRLLIQHTNISRKAASALETLITYFRQQNPQLAEELINEFSKNGIKDALEDVIENLTGSDDECIYQDVYDDVFGINTQ